jgi:hypothetical protein
VARILIAGALDFSKENSQRFVKHLGEEVIGQGHVLLDGCRNQFDRMVAKSAYDAAVAQAIDPNPRIISYAEAGAEPAHEFGTVLRSQLPSWGLEFARLHVPEPIWNSDAVMIVGGQEGTLCAANWARIANKPLLPITAFGGAGTTTYNEEIKDFTKKYSDRVDRLQYETLNQIADLQKVARDAVALAGKIQASTRVFVIMGFSGDPKLHDAYDTFKDTCREHGYECARVDETTSTERIVPQIFDGIARSAFVIADLTEPKPNVFYELGFAQGLKKPQIVTAHKGTILPFDVHDVPTIFWESQKQLREQLRLRIAEIVASHGR